MTAIRKILFEEKPVVATSVARAPAAKLYVVSGDAPAEARGEAAEATGSTLKNIALFLAAPFIGLVYIVLLPVVGLGFVAVLAGRAAAAKFAAVRTAARVLKNVVMVVAAPVVGLAYVVLFPVIGLAALAYWGGRAAIARA
jgi:hypothetical protein